MKRTFSGISIRCIIENYEYAVAVLNFALLH